ncbi:MAG: N-acetyl-gamma-glutamyl-phosphate reductase [Betaproteobacteria bacterium RIFCSPLOWO2_12_FULL_63_13]|nr:MAG: N-acetyl-gamma-glutamyl-phosphate reductase [Betaproteobacteria bacterium RIFCSPLOWO2_02_FULL_63_19]OGA43581.1 MAG: N-acetyl-gamma-glutamyl-phosphate reductase [Betaproteobacteria bacterium RIFCSPLOWO2_12_FULL_63_13]
MIKIGIVGGTGYTGVELLRILAQHPQAHLVAITSRKEAGMPVADMFPSLRASVSLAYSDPAVTDLAHCDLVFFATPNAVAMEQTAVLLDGGVRVIDLSADFRLRDVPEWEKWYGRKHAAPELVAQAVYGLPEVNRAKIRAARLVANPGCYPTAVQLGLLPLVAEGVVDLDHLIADAKSGVSGAGRKAETHILFSEASDSFRAYGVGGHRHWPEIRQGLAEAAGREVGLTFVPHLAPMIRGIHATLYARITQETARTAGSDTSFFQKLYQDRYAAEPYVDMLPAGSHPDTRSVRAANMCRIALHRPQGGGTLVVLSVIDNLVKGAAGQAVQNMNIMFGLPETTGLTQLPVVP